MAVLIEFVLGNVVEILSIAVSGGAGTIAYLAFS